jgi:hypothetical protein
VGPSPKFHKQRDTLGEIDEEAMAVWLSGKLG